MGGEGAVAPRVATTRVMDDEDSDVELDEEEGADDEGDEEGVTDEEEAENAPRFTSVPQAHAWTVTWRCGGWSGPRSAR